MGKQGLLIRAGGLLGAPLLAWLALPGRFSWWPLLFVCLVPLLLWLAAAPGLKRAAVRGLLAGLVLYPLQLYWIIPVLMTYGGLPWFLAVPALLLLAFYMGLYLALFSAGFVLFARSRSFALLALGAPALWVGLDWGRSWLFSGFPWMDLGYGLWELPQFVQAADLFGHYGYTFLLVLVNCAIFSVLSGFFPRPRPAAIILTALVPLLAVGAYSRLRGQTIEAAIAQAEAPLVGIVQGNVEQGRKWSPAERERTVANYVRLSETLLAGHAPALIVWPETALPFYPKDNELLEPVSRFVRRHGVTVMTGAPWYEVRDWDRRLIDYYNSALLMPASGEFSGFYHKSHLVPYGEYVPLKRFMPFIAPLVEAVGDFTPGRVGEPLTAGPVRAGVLICYESIFERLGRAWAENEANVLVNLTNDAWYGKSSAPYQSWAMTAFRSVETRRSLVRSANTGISGVIDPLGRVSAASELFVEWAAVLPVPLLTEQTIFVRGGFLFAPVCGAVALLLGLGTLVSAQRVERSVL